jgi:hypothetical protein
MNRLTAESYLYLLWANVILFLGRLEGLRRQVEKKKVRGSRPERSHDVRTVCRAVDLACLFSLRRVLCLQRSAATTLLLRRYGHNAQLVIGAKMFPFRSHAWVEIDGVVVNDKPYMLDIYQILDRF